MKLVKAIWILLCASVLASCGGSSGAGDSPFNPNGGTGGATAVADVVLVLSGTQLPNTGTTTITVTATALDAARNTLSKVPLTITADSDAIVTASGTETGTDGSLTGALSIGANRTNRVITVTAVSGTVSKSATVQVVGTSIVGTPAPKILAPSSAGSVQYRVVDQAGNAMAGLTIQITAAGLTPSAATGTTGLNGDYVFNYTAPATAGNYQIAATSGGDSDLQDVQVQAVGTFPTVTTPIVSGSVSANPSVVAINLDGSSANRSEIRALFVGAGNVPIPNVRVYFDLDGDPLAIGGSFTIGNSSSNLLYTNAEGVVTTSYVPSTRSSPTNGVTVRACYGVSDTDPNLLNCTTNAKQTLTVTSEPLNVTIGTNALIVVDTLTYTKQFNISVVDSSGAAKPDVNLVVSVDLPSYRKGYYQVGTSTWFKAGPLPTGDFAICPNEDKNRNAVLETGDDDNGNGSLEPRKADVRVSLLSTKTDANGSAVLNVIYDQDHASWVDAVITVSASGIAGTEGRAIYNLFPVPVEANSLKNTSNPPAYVVSPYGIAGVCSNPN